MNWTRLAPALLFTLLVGCASGPQQPDDETRNWSAEKLYEEARKAMGNSLYLQATGYFETLESRYPFNDLAKQGLIESAYAYYKYDEPETAIATADRFIRMNPRHPLVDYAFYIKGLVNFHKGYSAIDRFFDMDPAERDPGAARQAFRDFSELVNRFPDSRYAYDARQRMLFLRNNLARHEVLVADYYMRRGAYVAALNRAQAVLASYASTPAVEPALALMVRAYLALKMPDMAADTYRTLELNFPKHADLELLKQDLQLKQQG